LSQKKNKLARTHAHDTPPLAMQFVEALPSCVRIVATPCRAVLP